MKKVLFILMMAFVAVACKKAEVLEAPRTVDNINRSWKISTVSITENGIPESDYSAYTGFKLSFSGKDYTATNGGDAFPGNAAGIFSGTWGFDNIAESQISLSDGTVIAVSRLNASQFNFSFTRAGNVKSGIVETNTTDGSTDGNPAGIDSINPTRVFTFELIPAE